VLSREDESPDATTYLWFLRARARVSIKYNINTTVSHHHILYSFFKYYKNNNNKKRNILPIKKPL
jgi:hypothetical protein